MFVGLRVSRGLDVFFLPHVAAASVYLLRTFTVPFL